MPQLQWRRGTRLADVAEREVRGASSVLCSAPAVLFLLGQVTPLRVVSLGKEATYGFSIPHPGMLFLTGFAASHRGM